MPHPTTLARRKLREEDPERYEELKKKQRERDNRRNAAKRNAWEKEPHTRAQVIQRQKKLEAKRAKDRERYQAKKQAAKRKARSSAASSASPTEKRPRDMTPDENHSNRAQQKHLQRSSLSYQKQAAIRINSRNNRQQQRAEKLLPPISSVTSEAGPSGTSKLRQSLDKLNLEYIQKAQKLGVTSEEYAQSVLNLLNFKIPDRKPAIREGLHPTTLARRKMKEKHPEQYEEFRKKQRERDNRRNAAKRNALEKEPHTRAQVIQRQKKLEAKRAKDRERYYTKKQAAKYKSRWSAASSTSPTRKRPRDMTPDEYRAYRAEQQRLHRSRLSEQEKAAIRLKRREKHQQERAAKLQRLIPSVTAEAGPSETSMLKLEATRSAESHSLTVKQISSFTNPLKYSFLQGLGAKGGVHNKFKSPVSSQFKSPVTKSLNAASKPQGNQDLKQEIEKLKTQLQNTETEIQSLEAQGLKESELQDHISKLHEYNELKDVGQMILGRLATLAGVQTKDMYAKYGLNLED